jgi:inner membrane protein
MRRLSTARYYGFQSAMEPVTHFLTGACIGRAGLNRKTAYATLAAVLAAEAADLDILWSLAGPVEELKHHRGITHTFLAAPVVAGAVVAVIAAGHFWWNRRKPPASAPIQDSKSSPLPAPRWGWLYLTALIAALSHLLLDWTNNYGLRPFFPFNPRWYAGSFVFIAEPVLWVFLIIACIMPWIFGLADSEIGARRKTFRGRGWAIFALSAMVVVWCWRWAEHAQAQAMLENLQVTSAPVTRAVLEPYPVNPYRWHAILETAGFYQTAEVNSWTGEITSDQQRNVIYKPADTPALEAAKQTPLGKVYLDWGTWAVIHDLGQEPVPALSPPVLPPNRTWTTIEFSDLRFTYSYLGPGRPTGASPLSGWVYIIDNDQDGGEGMGGRVQK